jgi:DNA mismatch endonuclease (patch repair protein)
VRPDIVFTRLRIAVFIDGCFWHSCPLHGTRPRTNTEYWLPKLSHNVERDQRVDHLLRRAGWSVVRVWEHEPAPEAADRVVQAITNRR